MVSDKIATRLVAIICISGMTMGALLMGYDGAILASACALIGALAGYTLKGAK